MTGFYNYGHYVDNNTMMVQQFISCFATIHQLYTKYNNEHQIHKGV